MKTIEELKEQSERYGYFVHVLDEPIRIADMSGCDTDNYSIIGHFTLKDNNRLLLMRKNAGGAFQWCVKPVNFTKGRFHAVSGKYFDDFYSAADYAILSCGDLNNLGRVELSEAYRDHSHTGAPLKIPEKLMRS